MKMNLFTGPHVVRLRDFLELSHVRLEVLHCVRRVLLDLQTHAQQGMRAFDAVLRLMTKISSMLLLLRT